MRSSRTPFAAAWRRGLLTGVITAAGLALVFGLGYLDRDPHTHRHPGAVAIGETVADSTAVGGDGCGATRGGARRDDRGVGDLWAAAAGGRPRVRVQPRRPGCRARRHRPGRAGLGGGRAGGLRADDHRAVLGGHRHPTRYAPGSAPRP